MKESKILKIYGIVALTALLLGITLAIVSCGSVPSNGGSNGGVSYTCENGVAKSGKSSGTADAVSCQTCNDGFRLSGTAGADNTTCVATEYTCSNGNARTGSPAGTADAVSCQSCNSGYKLNGIASAINTACVATEYTCSNGNARTGSPTGTTDAVSCQSCNSEYKLNGIASAISTTCVATEYTCLNGSARTGSPAGTTDAVSCQSCSTGFSLMGIANVAGTTCERTSGSGNVYTCTNGMPRSVGTPSGGSDVVSCQSCNSEYKLNGVAGATSTTCVATEYTCLNGNARTGSPAGTTDAVSCQSCSTGFSLMGIANVAGTTCERTSGSGNVYTCTNGMPRSVGTPSGGSDVVSCQSCNSEYKLNGVASAINTACVATEYTCSNGNARTGSPASTADAVSCQTCNDGFRLSGTAGADNTACVTTQYTCENGIAKSGKPTGNDNVISCQSCTTGFSLMGIANADGTICEQTRGGGSVYTCTNGMPRSIGTPSGGSDVVSCQSCNSEYKLSGIASAINTACVATEYTCSNGNARTGSPTGTTDAVSCQSCNSEYKLNGIASAINTTCVATEYTCENGNARTGSPTGTTDAVSCQSCNSEYKLTGTPSVLGTACVQISYVCGPSVKNQPQVRSQTVGITGTIPTLATSADRTDRPATGEHVDVQGCGACVSGYVKIGDVVLAGCYEDHGGQATAATDLTTGDNAINGTTILGRTILGTIATDRDLDVFKVNVPTNTELIVRSNGRPSGAASNTATSGRFIDSTTGSKLVGTSSSNTDGDNGGFVLMHNNTTSSVATLYPEIREMGRNATGAYSVTIALDKVSDDITVSGDRTNARDIKVAARTDRGSSDIFYLHSGDSDLFGIETSTTKHRITATVTAVNIAGENGVAPILNLYAAAGGSALTDSIAYVNSLTGAGTSRLNAEITPSSRNFILQVSPPSSGITTGHYQLVVQVTALDAHPNTIPIAANVIWADAGTSGEQTATFNSGLEGANDTDHFRAAVKANFALVVQSSGSTNVSGRLLETNGSLIAADNTAAGSGHFRFKSAVATNAKDYNVEVKGDPVTTTGSYILNLATDAYSDDPATVESAGGAPVMVTNTARDVSVSGHLHTGDIDYIPLDLSAFMVDGRYIFTFAPTASVRVLNTCAAISGSNTATTITSDTVVSLTGKATPFCIEVKRMDNATSGNYNLRIILQ